MLASISKALRVQLTSPYHHAWQKPTKLLPSSLFYRIQVWVTSFHLFSSLCNSIVQYHHFSVTFIIPTDGTVSEAQKSLLESLPKSINSMILPPVNFDNLPEDARIETRFPLTVTRSLSSLRQAFKALTTTNRVSALVADLFGTDAFDVGNKFNVSPYIFYPTTAVCLSLFLHLPKLDETLVSIRTWLNRFNCPVVCSLMVGSSWTHAKIGRMMPTNVFYIIASAID
ncbi:hypothetical protein NE237_028397 [Protea cynaroides]|uniref:Uncharacterized protein n=1 Tax=Protea cynaroides TaxID=273540 RepID=A0A9Q0GSA6_9MAGN|nr:hypothetical protein NE237_028397 [Protea cynaroides]